MKPPSVALLEQLSTVANKKFSVFSLHKTACETITYRNMQTCGSIPIMHGAKIIGSGGLRIKLSGVNYCKNYQVCPRCHLKWIQSEKRKLKSIMNSWPGEIAQAVFTLPHSQRENLSTSIKNLKVVLKSFFIKKSMKSVEVVLTVEVKLTKNGWHPHIHAVLFKKTRFKAGELSAIEMAWSESSKKHGMIVGSNAAHLSLIDKTTTERIAEYSIKSEYEGSVFNLLKVIKTTSDLSIRDEAKSIWRNFVRQINNLFGVRFITCRGAHVKTAWSAKSSSTATRARAEIRASLLHDEWIDLTEGKEHANPYLSALDPLANLPKGVLEKLEKIESEIEDIYEELEYSGYHETQGSPQHLRLEELYIEQTKLLNASTPEQILATITPLGLRILSPADKDALGKSTSLRDIRMILEEAVDRLTNPLDSICYYCVRYGADNISSIYFQPRTLPGVK